VGCVVEGIGGVWGVEGGVRLWGPVNDAAVAMFSAAACPFLLAVMVLVATAALSCCRQNTTVSILNLCGSWGV
jgi:hypothetical protein